MLTTEDKEEIKRILVETLARSDRSFTGGNKRAGEIDQADILLNEVDVTARAIEVFGTREKALRWLKTPVRWLGGRTPLSLLNSATVQPRCEILWAALNTAPGKPRSGRYLADDGIGVSLGCRSAIVSRVLL